jgi:peptidoglycan LD-endopeptidase CwlK
VSELTVRDHQRLVGVHADLVLVVREARMAMPFMVIDGVRTPEAQAAAMARGASQTLNSRHLTGHAVDLGPLPLDWNDLAAFRALAGVMLGAAQRLGVPLRWGGTFRRRDGRPWFDGPHYELPREAYP